MSDFVKTDSMLKLEKEELIIMFRRVQRKADKYEILFRKCASQLWELKNQDLGNVTTEEYFKSKNEELIDEIHKVKNDLEQKTNSLTILREQNKKLISALKSINPNFTW